MVTGLVLWLLIWLYGYWFVYMVPVSVIWLLVWLYGYWFGYTVARFDIFYWFGYCYGYMVTG